jgi:hypothetical protein
MHMIEYYYTLSLDIFVGASLVPRPSDPLIRRPGDEAMWGHAMLKVGGSNDESREG